MDQHRRSVSQSLSLPVLAIVILALATGAVAQTVGSAPAAISRGYGLNANALESPINVSNRDADGNLTIVNGVMQTGGNGGVFSNLYSPSGSGVATGASGATGAGSATAIGNNLSVVVDGQYNTVIVNATQTNNGAISASTVLNGKVNLDGGQ